MSIIEKFKTEIQTLTPDNYKNAMLLRFGLADGVTHSRDDVCQAYDIDKETALLLESEIINKVFKS